MPTLRTGIRWPCWPVKISIEKRYLKVYKQLCSTEGCGWGTVRQNQGEVVWGELKKEPVLLIKIPSKALEYHGNRFHNKGKREAKFCEGFGVRTWGYVCLGVSRGVTSHQSSNSRRHSINV